MGMCSAPHLASSSAELLPRRNECPGTHGSLIKQEEREDSFCQICQRISGKRNDGGEDRVVRVRKREKRNGRLVGTAETSGRLAEWHRLLKKLEHTGSAEKERVDSVPQSEQLASMPELFLPKGKETEPFVHITRS